ncbi:hypothetical protein [Miltoncostaea oceani]|uniref:hypothetical protein n=1 Tax=Miltoncostaea oceani TaxID=2843216 RepID=UPI001C3DA921|nr:hypothetical protein [Miltoncostaea oceani]
MARGRKKSGSPKVSVDRHASGVTIRVEGTSARAGLPGRGEPIPPVRIHDAEKGSRYKRRRQGASDRQALRGRDFDAL